jgi:tRNA threonylcarbamoyladenosine biosynthesis protein TsaE
LQGGDVVYVLGELGAGKTTFVRGACRALGVAVPVTSPTFAIAHRYHGRDGLLVAHLDLYRVEDPGGADAELVADYLDAETIAFVEWPPQQAGLLPPPRLTVELSHLDAGGRAIEVRA